MPARAAAPVLARVVNDQNMGASLDADAIDVLYKSGHIDRFRIASPSQGARQRIDHYQDRREPKLLSFLFNRGDDAVAINERSTEVTWARAKEKGTGP